MQFLLKVVITALIVAAVSELGKRFTLVGAIVASLPLTSILALTWLWLDTGETKPVADLSAAIFWAVLPSLLFFVLLPLLLRGGVSFPTAMLIACAVMAGAYGLYLLLLRQFGIAV